MCSALVSREQTSGSPIDSCQGELSPSDPIESVCQLFNPPLAPVNPLLPVPQTPCTHFRFRSRSDSIRLGVKSTGLRWSVLDMYGGLVTVAKREAILFLFGCSEVNSTWLITSEWPISARERHYSLVWYILISFIHL